MDDGLRAGDEVTVVRSAGEVHGAMMDGRYLARLVQVDAQPASGVVDEGQPANVRTTAVFLGADVWSRRVRDGRLPAGDEAPAFAVRIGLVRAAPVPLEPLEARGHLDDRPDPRQIVQLRRHGQLLLDADGAVVEDHQPLPVFDLVAGARSVAA